MTTTLRRIDPTTARRLIQEGLAVLIDIREPDEHARERIAGARSLPLSRLETAAPVEVGDRLAILHCRSGSRTAANAARLAGVIQGECALLDGGIEAWKAAGQPVERDQRRPIEVMRQVQIAAGSLVLLGTILGVLAAPWFLLVPAFVGTGLVFAGVTGWCGMAKLLSHAPWNQVPAAPLAS